MNKILTDSVITKECLRELKNQLAFTKSVNRGYDDRFAVSGAKIGDVVNIRKPNRYIANDGPVLIQQDTQEESIALKLDHHKHVGMGFSQRDLTLSIDSFRERYIKPAVTTLANSVDSTGYQEMYKQVYSSVGAPLTGVYPSTLKQFNLAKAQIALLGGDVTELTSTIDPMVEASLVEGNKGLFQSSEQIAMQYEKGVMGMAAGSKFKSTQNVAKHRIGSIAGGAPLINGVVLDGATQLSLDGFTPNALLVLRAGDVISLTGVESVNPQTRITTGLLAQFVVMVDVSADGAGAAIVQLDRAIVLTGVKQNVTALPADNAPVLTFGHASNYANQIVPQNMVFHKDAFALACADIELPKGMDMAARASDPESGLSVALVRGFDLVNYRTITRLDIIFGWKCIYPEYACRVVGQ